MMWIGSSSLSLHSLPTSMLDTLRPTCLYAIGPGRKTKSGRPNLEIHNASLPERVAQLPYQLSGSTVLRSSPMSDIRDAHLTPSQTNKISTSRFDYFRYPLPASGSRSSSRPSYVSIGLAVGDMDGTPLESNNIVMEVDNTVYRRYRHARRCVDVAVNLNETGWLQSLHLGCPCAPLTSFEGSVSTPEPCTGYTSRTSNDFDPECSTEAGKFSD
jgi:hypothetical protein